MCPTKLDRESEDYIATAAEFDEKWDFLVT